MNGVVAKPIDASRLLEAISKAVGTSLAKRALARRSEAAGEARP
jgi:AmiR/NasT family two-component response regulator